MVKCKKNAAQRNKQALESHWYMAAILKLLDLEFKMTMITCCALYWKEWMMFKNRYAVWEKIRKTENRLKKNARNQTL